MTDEDGDGVEDNVKFTASELDRFYKPPVFGAADEIYNTQHGGMPGHKQLHNYQDLPTYREGDTPPWPKDDGSKNTIADSGMSAAGFEVAPPMPEDDTIEF